MRAAEEGGEGPRVRPARPEDAETLARFNEALALETEGLRLDPLAVRAGVRAVLEDPSRGRYLVAERGGGPAGALLLTPEWSDWRNAVFLWIQSVYVDPAHRRRGVLRALFRAAEEAARSPGCCGLRLYVEEGNRSAREAYASLGLAYRGYLVLEAGDALREAAHRRDPLS